MPSVRMKMGIHHWYGFITVLISFVCSRNIEKKRTKYLYLIIFLI